jgi:hypothetical protein
MTIRLKRILINMFKSFLLFIIRLIISKRESIIIVLTRSLKTIRYILPENMNANARINASKSGVKQNFTNSVIVVIKRSLYLNAESKAIQINIIRKGYLNAGIVGLKI